MISKKLLSEVLDVNVTKIVAIQQDMEDGMDRRYGTVLWFDAEEFFHEIINIYELAHKCKEWATTKDYSIQTGNRLDGTGKYDVLCTHKDYDGDDFESDYFYEMVDTEPEAIFKACEWISKEIKC